MRLLVVCLVVLGPAGWSAAQPGTAPEIALDRFGVGGVVRPGDWSAVRLAVREPGAAVRRVLLQIELTDADGDTARWRRAVTLNPGQTAGVWVPCRLPYWLSPTGVIRCSVIEPVAPDGLGGTRELASVPVAPETVIDPASPLIGLVGRAAAGLDRYRVAVPGTAAEPATGHEWIEFALIDPDALGTALPDSWLGLEAMRAVVWTEGEPGDIRAPAAAALAEWVRRGGHLVVVVPESGSSWSAALSGPLGAVLPRVTLTRHEGVDLASLRPLLTPNDAVPLPTGAITHSFEPARGAGEAEAVPILAGPGGETLVVRRTTGAGAVTMIGIDVARRDLAARLDPQRFWHRVLGERFDVLSQTEMHAMLQRAQPANFRNRTPVWVDDAVGVLINQTGRAGAGVLLAFTVFVSYWVIAGPGGFALLRWFKLSRYSWVVFVGVAALFTGIAWTGATALRPVRVEVTHVSFVDHVFGQSAYRVRSWMGALLPRYGETAVSIEPAPGEHHALTPWEPPAANQDTFPDPRAYTVAARRPESIELPTRATVRELRADWFGPPPWRSVWPSGTGIELSPAGQLSGTIEHGFPAALEDVVIVLVQRQSAFRTPTPGALQARTLAWRLAGPWEAGEGLDLAGLDAASGATVARGDVYLDGLTRRARGWAGLFGTLDERTALEKLEILNWGPVIGPPPYQRMTSATGFPALVHRRLGHGLDLARWFTQPCLIVTGHARTPVPLPLRIDGETPPSDGVTMLRWVYPLPADPPAPVETVP